MPDIKLVVVVEDELSGQLCKRVVDYVTPHLVIDRVVIARGNGNIRAKLGVYEQASRFVKHLVLTDLDRATCAPDLIRDWRISPQTSMLFRVAVREVEAWIMADRGGFSDHFGVPHGKIPNNIETNFDPKATLVALVKKSRNLRTKGMAPDVGNYSHVGPMYNQRLAEFVNQVWSVDEAARGAPSLGKLIARLSEYGSTVQ